MAPRNPENRARLRLIEKMTSELSQLEPYVLEETGWKNQAQLNAKIGSKNDTFFDLKNQIINSCEEFSSLWLKSLNAKAETSHSCANLLNIYEKSTFFKKYCDIYIQRSFAIHFPELSITRPTVDEALIWIGDNGNEYGIGITPRFKKNSWENDKSEIRRVKFKYWTIGHIIKTGLLIPNKEEVIRFSNVKDYLLFFKNVIIRSQKSIHEVNISEKYCEYVLSQKNQQDIPLLIPQFRYGGLEKKHVYRLDFMIINPYNMNKIGIELSPWSTHGNITGTKNLSQSQINNIASENFEKEIGKMRTFFNNLSIPVITYSKTLNDVENIFDEIKKHLNPEKPQLKISFAMKEKYGL